MMILQSRFTIFMHWQCNNSTASSIIIMVTVDGDDGESLASH